MHSVLSSNDAEVRMKITYRDQKIFSASELQELYLSVDWDSGNYPEKLVQAIAGSHGIFSAWDDEKLIGLISVISDGHMAAYIHYLLVRPEYQGHGIGKELINQMATAYADVSVKVLVAYNTKASFYEQCGFSRPADKTPMFMTSMRL